MLLLLNHYFDVTVMNRIQAIFKDFCTVFSQSSPRTSLLGSMKRVQIDQEFEKHFSSSLKLHIFWSALTKTHYFSYFQRF